MDNEVRLRKGNKITKLETQEREANLRKIDVEIAKMLAETKQVTVNTFLAPALAAAALMGTTAALVKLFF